MKLQRNITTASTPQTITTVQSVTGKVWHVTPPNSVILTLEDGTNQSFKIPNGQKFTIDGQQVDRRPEQGNGCHRHQDRHPAAKEWRPRRQEPHPRFLKVVLCLGGVQSGMKLGGRIEGKSVGADHAFD